MAEHPEVVLGNIDLLTYAGNRANVAGVEVEHADRYAIDSSKARRELGWQPKWRPEEGFAQTIDWYRDHRDWWTPLYSAGAGVNS